MHERAASSGPPIACKQCVTARLLLKIGAVGAMTRRLRRQGWRIWMATLLAASAPRAATATPLGPGHALVADSIPGARLVTLNRLVGADDPALPPDLLQAADLGPGDRPIDGLFADLSAQRRREASVATVPDRAPVAEVSYAATLTYEEPYAEPDSGLTLARVPEPASILLLGTALTAFAVRRRTRRR